MADFNFIDSPLCVFGDEGGVVSHKCLEFREVFFIAGVSKSDTDVANEAFVLDSFDGRFGKDLAKFFDR